MSGSFLPSPWFSTNHSLFRVSGAGVVMQSSGFDRLIRVRYPRFPRHIFRLPPRLHLLEHGNDLRLGVSGSGHAPPPFQTAKSYSVLCGFRGAGQFDTLFRRIYTPALSSPYYPSWEDPNGE